MKRRGLATAALLSAIVGCSDGGSEAPPGETSSSTTTQGSKSMTGALETTTTSTSGSTTDALDSTTTSSSDGSSGTTGVMSMCGNDRLDDEEPCDGADLGGVTCEGLGHPPGDVTCTADCELDLHDCAPEGMVFVAAGTFEMGSDEHPDEQPIRHPHLDDFYIDRTEVTVASYYQCVDAGICPALGTSIECPFDPVGIEDHPVTCIHMDDSAAYCAWVDKRLPTEAEWEKTARGTDGRRFPWGDEPPTCELAVMDDLEVGGDGCGSGSTLPVGSRPLGASPYGALDMAGNAWEWVADWYTPYDPDDLDNPVGPLEGEPGVTRRIRRGGGWYDAHEASLRSAYRHRDHGGHPSHGVGFRCALTP